MNQQRFSIAVGLLLVLLGGAAGAAGAAQLRAVRLDGDADAVQRLALELDAAPRLRTLQLGHPTRTVIDLEGTRAARALRLPSPAGRIRSMRLGWPRPHVLRIVLETDGRLRARTAWVARRGAGGQMLITLVPAGLAASPAAARVAREGTPPAIPVEGMPVEASATGLDEARVVHAAHAPREGSRDIVVAIDAGHGGNDPGAIGVHGTREKDVTLAIARALARRIEAEPGMHAVLTRDRDEFVVLRDRIRRARLAHADMFVSVHADSIVDHGVGGASVYVLSERGATSEAARILAERENAADLMGGAAAGVRDPTLRSVLLDLSQSANISASMTAAERVIAALDGVGAVRKAQVQQAGFVVLKSPDIPSMLIETAYISNPVEEQGLGSARHQAALAEAIFGGVRRYFETSPPPGTRFAQLHRASVAGLTAPPAPAALD